MSQHLTKHPEVIQKENRIQELQEQLKKRKTTLKSLKTRLSNMQKDIDGIYRKVQGEMMGQLARMDELRQDIQKWAAELLKSNNIPESEKVALRGMISDLANEDFFGEGYAQYKKQRAKAEAGNFDFDEETRAKVRDMFQEFKVKPPEKEQRNIRKTYLKLSQKFHPDLAKTEQEQTDFHKIQQQINEAYQNNDIHALLELERMYVTEEFDFTAASVSMDDLDKIIKRLENDLNLIKNQVSRTSDEIKNLRQSDMGQMLTHIDRAERYGEGLDAATSEQEEMIKALEQLRDGLKDSVERDGISPLLINIMMGEMGEDPFEGPINFNGENPEDLMELLQQLTGGDENSLQDLFEGGFDEMQVENPKFPIGSSVKIKSNVRHDLMPKLNMKNWEGRVISAFYDDVNQKKIIYDIEFDSITMQQMPSELIEEAVSEDLDFQEHEIEEKNLKAALARDTEDQAFITFRRLFFEENWSYLDDKSKDRLRKILFQFPAKEDEENWDDYLLKHLKFPFKAQTKGLFEYMGGMPENITLKITEIAGRNFEVGYIMLVEDMKTKQSFTHPLVDFEIKGKSNQNLKQLLNDYNDWAEDVYDL